MNVLKDFAAKYGINLAGCVTLLDVLVKIAMEVLGVSEQEACRIAHKRLVKMKSASAFSNELLEIDDVATLFNEQDSKVLHEEQKKAHAMRAEKDAFKSDYRAFRARFNPPEPPPEPAGKGRGRGAGRGGRGGGPPVPPPLPAEIPQVRAKECCPPGGHIWIGHTVGTWNGHFEPYRRCSFSWTLYTEPVAMKKTLGTLRDEYLEFNALPDSSCPWPELLALARD